MCFVSDVNDFFAIHTKLLELVVAQLHKLDDCVIVTICLCEPV
jgi:hypothetical protein